MSDADFLWKLIAVLGVVGGMIATWIKIKGGHAMRIADQPVQVQAAARYVTHDELTQIIQRIDRVELELIKNKEQTDENLKEIFKELRGIARAIGRMEGKQSVE